MTAHDVSAERRDEHGRWTASGGFDPDTKAADTKHAANYLRRVKEYLKTAQDDPKLWAKMLADFGQGVEFTPEELGALRSYLGDDFSKLNGPLRTGVLKYRYGARNPDGTPNPKPVYASDKGKEAANFRGAVKAMDAAVAKLPAYEGASTRLVYAEGEKLDRILAAYEKGRTVTEDGYTSAQAGKKGLVSAGLYDREPNITISIDHASGKHVPKGTGSYSSVGEDEVIYPRGTRFKVSKVEKTSDGRAGSGNARSEPPSYHITLTGP